MVWPTSVGGPVLYFFPSFEQFIFLESSLDALPGGKTPTKTMIDRCRYFRLSLFLTEARSLLLGLWFLSFVCWVNKALCRLMCLLKLPLGRRDAELRVYLFNYSTSLLGSAILDGFHSGSGTTEVYLAGATTRNHDSKVPTRARRLLSTEPGLSVRARRLLSISIPRGSIG